MIRRARAAASVAVALAVLSAVACSDDAPRASTTTTSTTAPAWRTVELLGRPSALDVSPDGGVVVVDDALGQVQWAAADPATSVFGPVQVGGPLVGVAASAPGVLWLIDATGVATRVPGTDPARQTSVDLGGTLVDVVATADVAYIGDLEGRLVVELDATTGAVRGRIPVADGVVRLALDGDRLWVTGADHTVTPIDLTTGVAGAPVPVGNGPIGLAVADGTVWVANGDDGTVSRLDAATGDRRGPDADVGAGPIALSVRGDDVWVLNQDPGTLSHLTASTGRRVEPDIAIPGSIGRARDLVVSDEGVWIVGTDRAQAAFLPAR